MHYTFSDDGPFNNLRNVWWESEDLIIDFHRYGVALGVSIDAKIVEKNFGTPLVTIYGSTPADLFLIYAKDNFQDETE